MFDIASDTFNFEMDNNNNDFYYNNNDYYVLDDQPFDEDNLLYGQGMPGQGLSNHTISSQAHFNQSIEGQNLHNINFSQNIQPTSQGLASNMMGSGNMGSDFGSNLSQEIPIDSYQQQHNYPSYPQSYQTPSNQSQISSTTSQSQTADDLYHPYYLHSANVDLSNLSTPSLSSQYSPGHAMYVDLHPMAQQVTQLNNSNTSAPNYSGYNSLNQSTQSLHSNGTMVSQPHPILYNVPHSSMGQSFKKDRVSPKSPSSPPNRKRDENKIITSNKSNFRIVRGVAAGGSSARPPKESLNSSSTFIPIELNIIGGKLRDVVRPEWSLNEFEDQRRIVRIERFQKNEMIFVNFSIIGSAVDNPVPLPPPANSNIDIIEVSCLQCSKKLSDEIDLPSPIVEDAGTSSTNFIDTSDQEDPGEYEYDYYITSVEVIEIVELLIGMLSDEPSERRKERGRVRSNLVPYWSKKPISSRLENNSPNQPDYKIELAKRIMSYEIRRPRGFDKEVRILKWEKLVPALKRALQSYYCEIPPTV